MRSAIAPAATRPLCVGLSLHFITRSALSTIAGQRAPMQPMQPMQIAAIVPRTLVMESFDGVMANVLRNL